MSKVPGVSIHPTALVETRDVGAGTRVWAFAHIMAGARVGRDCNVCDHAFIEGGAVVGDRVTVKNNSLIWHGVTIGDEVFVGPNVVFTNDLTPRVRFKTGPDQWIRTFVGAGASIGANATIVCGVTIGREALVGAGSVVTTDVPDHALVYGNPARQHGWACTCGRRLDTELKCVCGGAYRMEEGHVVPLR
jgi:acetyltransferase-like isoleucine patch superfamily enzyme